MWSRFKNVNQSELLTPNQTINENDLTTTVPEVSHNSSFLLQHSRFCRLTCSPIGKDDNPEPKIWALLASLMWEREDSMISSWTSDSSCENAYQILLMMLADLQHPSTVQSQSWDPGLRKCKSRGSHQSYARWEQEQAAEPHLHQRLNTHVITKFRQNKALPSFKTIISIVIPFFRHAPL